MSRLRARVAALLLLLIVGGVLVPSLPRHVHAGESLVPDLWRETNPGPYSVDVAVAVDDEWMETLGPDAAAKARRVLELAAANVRPAQLRLRFSGLRRWNPGDDAGTIHSLLAELERAYPAGEAQLVVGLTAGSYEGKVDGVARSGRPYVVVRHHSQGLERDAYVLTHELGHVLGLDHHTCRDRLCFMADHGYDPQEHWCSDHLELLKANAGYFFYAGFTREAPPAS